MFFNILDYTSPANEASIFKGIPIEKIGVVRGVLKKLTLIHGGNIKYRIRARGPRPHNSAHCRMSDATTFAVYMLDKNGHQIG